MTRETEQKLAEIISDEEIVRVHGSANFGPTMTPREVVNDGVRKSAVGYHCGHTQFCILREHGLITARRAMSYDVSLTKKGKRYARALSVFAAPPAPSPDTGKMGGENSYRAIALTLSKTVEQLIYGLPDLLKAGDLKDEEGLIDEAGATLDAAAHRLAQLDLNVPVSGGEGEAVALPDIAAEGERIVRDTYRPEGGSYLWTDVVGAVQTAIAEERARHTHPSATERMRADAERYHFLRSRDPGPDGELPSSGPFIGLVPDNLILTEADADEAIDAARAALGEA